MACERETSESEAEVLEQKAKAKEKEELNKINETLKDAAKVRAEDEKQSDDYQKNAMISPDAQNKRADELLKSVKNNYLASMEKEKLFNEFQKYASDNIISFISQEMKEKFETYFAELIEWNKFLNLISFKSEKDLIYRHFCDSLYSAKIISEIAGKDAVLKTTDIGTGSGMPGIPVKIVLPNIKMTLVESITKKCKFLENVNNKLDICMEILNSRAEEIGQSPKYRQQYDFVLSRAVSKFSPNLEISIPLLKVGGYFIVHKTKKSAESVQEGLPSVENALKYLGAKLDQTIAYNLPEQELDYCILVFKKYKDTPTQFPHKPGMPEKKPL